MKHYFIFHVKLILMNILSKFCQTFVSRIFFFFLKLSTDPKALSCGPLAPVWNTCCWLHHFSVMWQKPHAANESGWRLAHEPSVSLGGWVGERLLSLRDLSSACALLRDLRGWKAARWLGVSEPDVQMFPLVSVSSLSPLQIRTPIWAEVKAL